MIKKNTPALLIPLTLTGCMIGPDYKAPQVKVNPSYTETQPPPTTQASTVTTIAPPPAEWWTTFRDPELDSLIQRAVKSNWGLATAAPPRALVRNATCAVSCWLMVENTSW